MVSAIDSRTMYGSSTPCDSGSFFTTARIIYVAGKEGYLPAVFGRLNSRLSTPLNAMLLQAAITVAFIFLGDGFRSLINFAVVLAWIFFFLTVSHPDFG